MVDFQRADRYGLEDLLRIMELLRAPGGCPWDRAQTHQSIRQNMLEEAYEAAEAIDRRDMDNLREELGDVLLQVVFHARMAQEAGAFGFSDVVDGVCKKLVFRHPHVFGEAEAGDLEGSRNTWDAQKREEKGQRTAADTLDSVARALPALTRAGKLQDKAQRAGFDWREAGPALDKLFEEAEELRRAARGDGDVQEELGDLLFAAVKAGRAFGADGELALHAACEKFIRRFRRVEQLAPAPLGELDVPVLEALWTRAKGEERDHSNT